MNLFIIELRAHLAGHYSKELHDFAGHISQYCDTVHLITPFGFKESFPLPSNAYVHALLSNKKAVLTLREQLSFYRRALKLIPQNKDAVIHIWGYQSILPLYISVRGQKLKLAILLKTVYRDRHGLFKNKIAGFLQTKISNYLLSKLARLYMAHTDALLKDAASIGIEVSRIKKIGTGITIKNILPTAEEAKKELNLEGFKVLLFYGVIREGKGIDDFVPIISSFPDNYKIVIAGENWLDFPLNRITGFEQSSSKIVVINKYLTEKETELVFRAADAVIIYHKDTFKGESGVLLQAVQYNVPVLALKGSHAAEVIAQYRVGEVVADRSVTSFLIATGKLFSGSEDYCSNLATLRSQLNWQNIVKEYVNFYKLL